MCLITVRFHDKPAIIILSSSLDKPQAVCPADTQHIHTYIATSPLLPMFHFIKINIDNLIPSLFISFPLQVYHAKLLMFSDSMIIVNIIVNFFTGYIEGYSRKVSVLSKKKIAWKYLTTWLVLDVVACFAIPISYDTTEHTIYMLLEAMKLVRLPIIMVYLQNVLTVMKASVSWFCLSVKILMNVHSKMYRNNIHTHLFYENRFIKRLQWRSYFPW